jgi:hypothetical protein
VNFKLESGLESELVPRSDSTRVFLVAQVRGKWIRTVECNFPHLSALSGGIGAGAAPISGAANGQTANNRGRGRGRGAPQATTRGRGGGRGGGSIGRPAAAGPPAFHQGIPVCYNFNNPSGCNRTKLTQSTCQDRNGAVYAHVCDHWDGSTSKHCLGPHSRQVQGNH